MARLTDDVDITAGRAIVFPVGNQTTETDRMMTMEGISSVAVDELIVKTFAELKRAVDTYSKGSVELHSSALRALILLRQVFMADERGDGA